MHAAIFHEFGSPEVIRYEEVPDPPVAPGEVLVEVRAAAMNHLDLWVRKGLIDVPLPHIGGADIAGVVRESPQGSAFTPGTRVVVNPLLFCGVCRECRRGEVSLCVRKRLIGEHVNGGFADLVAVPSANLSPIPDHIDFRTAACLPVSYQTAWRAIVTRGNVQPGDDVLVVGASGGTAIAAIQIALLAGARVHAVTSGPEKVERVRALGAEFVYDRDKVDWSREAFRNNGRRGVDVVVESVGAPTWEKSVRALAPGGRLVTYGATAGHLPELDLRRLFWHQTQLIGTTMASLAEFDAMLRAVREGRLRPVIDSVLPLAEARQAHQRLEAGEQFGKIVMER